MATNIDKLYLENLTRLVREVLIDEAKFVAKGDTTNQNLHTQIFSKEFNTPFSKLAPEEKLPFRKYFYVQDTPRTDVPYSDSPLEQAAFFDTFRNQIRFCTYNYERMGFVLPTFKADDDTPEFNEDQNKLLTEGVVYSLIHSLEAREIANIEKQQGTGTDEKSDNPYKNLEDKILVKGESGEFDTILTFAQIEEIAGQEEMLKSQGLPPEEAMKLLKEYINKRFPGIKPYISPQGKIVTFLGNAGISASGAAVGEDMKGEMRFTELIKEMKMRQCRYLQYEMIIAGKGTLGFASGSFQIKTDGATLNMEGLAVGLDRGGLGNNGVFFEGDIDGTAARVNVDTSVFRITGKPDFHIKLYENPEEDSPANPRIRLGHPSLPLLRTPLRDLYRQLREAQEYSTAQSRPIKPPSAEQGANKPPETPETSEGKHELPMTAGHVQVGGPKQTLPGQQPTPPKPKTAEATRNKSAKKEKKRPGAEATLQSQERQRQKARQEQAARAAAAQTQGGRQGQLEQEPQEEGVEDGQTAQQKKKTPKALVAAGVTALASVGAMAPGIIKLFV